MRHRIEKNVFTAWNVAIVLALLLGAYFLRHYISVIIFATIAAFLFNPIHQWFLKRYKRPGISASLTFLISLVIIIIPVCLIILIVVLQINHLLNSISTNSDITSEEFSQLALDTINGLLAHIPGTSPLAVADVTAAINQFIANLANSILDIITSSVGNLSRFITSSIIYIYLFVNILMHQNELVEIVNRLNPLGRQMSNKYLQQMGSMTKAMTLGQFVIAILQGLESAIVLYLVGLQDLFLFFLIFLSFLSLIPLGAGIVTIPLGIILVLTGSIWQGLVVIANHLLITTNIDNIIRPKLVPKNAALNSALTILSVFAGVNMFGFLGIIVGPVIMIVIVTTIRTYLEQVKN